MKLKLQEKKLICRWIKEELGGVDYDGYLNRCITIREDLMTVYRKMYPKDWD